MDSSQGPLVAGLLTTLISATVAPSSSTPTTLPIDSPNHDDQPEGMHHWSSLIGIVTALIGNVLISLALNIQRYAHIRITREWERDNTQKEAAGRQSHTGLGSAGPYGAVGIQRGRSREHFEYRDEEEETSEDTDGTSRPRDRQRESFTSDGTARPGDKKTARADSKKNYLRSPYWWAGLVLMCLGETGNFLAYGFAPASIVSPLGVVALISNCIIAPCLLKEKFRQRDFWGVLVAIAGAVVVVLSAKSSEEKIGPHEIWVMITRWEFLLYLAISIILIIVLMWASGTYGPRSILIDIGLVGLFGGYTALSTKGVASLLSFTLWHVITFPITYLLVFVLVFSALMQIRYINRALQRFDSTQVIPTQFVLFTLSVIIGSAVLYRDFESIPAARAVKFVGGCLLTFLGVYFITSGRVRSDDASSYSSEDEEEAIGLLHGERYQDRVDLSPPGQQLRVQRELRTAPETQRGRSPSGSLLSQGIDGIDDGQSTPKGALSVVTSSPGGSLSADSPLSAPFSDHPSPLRPPSHMSNPWADRNERAVGTERPTTPQGQSNEATPRSTVQLRYPPAPGVEDTPPLNEGRRASTPTTADQPHFPGRSRTSAETPPRRALRNSISNRFSPGPLFPTLSAGFSAVVAESLRRGEGNSSVKDRTKRKLERRRPLDGAFRDGIARYHDGDDGPAGVGGDGHDTPATIATARLQSATSLAAAPAEVGRSSTPALATEIYALPTQSAQEGATRVRSLSESMSGGLAWLGGVLRKTHADKYTESAAVSQGTPTPPNGDNGPGDTGAQAETRQ
ncbi:hypothetical protein N7474_001926 [Penicillium riverlandense]|uniref:uncharacterized protein n=1 Tax=Penicillium riverlandense TaxID=1903569 RepID=UPI002546FEBC|nr:uncharacterized protein N7474_001926 [Penicillium riverlandense]KAJ5833615.1 hypothetical protein N7474_001926 [Penicillium riverlandense]